MRIRIGTCLLAALFFGARSLAALETVKESQIDQHLSYIDGTLKQMDEDRKEARNKRDGQVDDLKRQNSELESRIAKDEGIGAGASAIVGVLSGLGFLKTRGSK